MKTVTKLLALALIGFAAFVSNPTAQAALGQWDFNSSNLTATAGATLGDLTYVGGVGSATALATTFGATNISGTNAIIMGFPAATNGMGYRMPNPGPTGGSTVNLYTYILDVFYPAASSGKIRPLIQTEDGTHLGSQQFIVIDSTGGIGPLKIGASGFTGPYVGNILPNTWYRIAIAVTAGGTIRVYTNGVAMGSFGGGAVEGFFALDPNMSALILGDTSTNAALGFVNSIQLRDSVLTAGQISALGAASADGIPIVIPPVPSFISSRTPDVGEIGVSEVPAINIVLDQGDTTVNSGTIQLKLDGAVVGATVTPTPPTYTIDYTVPPRLDPLSAHTLSLIYSDSVAGNQTNTWSFTVKNYQVVTLPAPFYFENFDSLTENATNGVALPAGWTVANQTAPQTAGFNLDDRSSDSYKDWILVSSSRLPGWGTERTDLPTIILNGTKLTTLTSGNLLWAESDARCGSCYGQFSDLFTAPISCVGRSNVFVAFNSIYEQNQDNMNFIEYSVDGGVNWLPALYYFMYPGDAQEAQPDIIYYTNGPLAGTIDVTNTFGRIDNNRNWSPDIPVHATNYGSYIKAPINNSLIPAIMARRNDDSFDGKRIEVIRLAAADGKADVRFRVNANGTSSWFWGIDDFGLYEINTPVITGQPANATVAAGTGTNFTVVASSPSPLSYQWQHAGTNISNGGHYANVTTANLTVSNADPNNAGAYRVRVSNSSGFVFSSPATLTVITVPIITTQPNSAVVSDGYPASFSVVGFGGLPLSYQWYHDGSPVGGATGTTLSIASAHSPDAGSYTAVITNSYGSVTSRVALLSVSVGGITNNLVVHLKFDGNYNDSSGHGNNGTAVGSPGFAAGIIGNSMQYTDADSGASLNYVTLDNPVGTHPADLRMGAGTSFSISFWYKVPVGNRHGDPAIVSNKDWDSGSNQGFSVFNSGSGLQWNYREVDDGINSNSRKDSGGTSPGIEDGNWHHCVVVYQRGGGASSYVDGNLVNATALATPNPAGGFFAPTTIDNDPATPRTRTATGAWNIGEDGSGLYTTVGGGHDGPGISVTNAMIDDLGIWRRALSPQEALAIYNAGQAGQSLAQAGVPLGKLTVSVSGGNVNFTWAGGPGIKLQKTSPLVPASWVNIDSTLGNSSYSEAITASPTFYRLFKP